jgi:thymidylate kinase
VTDRGFAVALIGPDGAGKTTVARRLQHELGLPCTYLYMGVNPTSSNRLLPTTRLAQALKVRRGATGTVAAPRQGRSSRGPFRRAVRGLRSGAWLMNRLAEETYRLALSWRARRRGLVVILDRDFYYDYHATDVSARAASPGRRLHGALLRTVYPKPDLVVYLDAPPEVVLARKGEGSLESVAARREQYLELVRQASEHRIVDATLPLDAVVDEVARHVRAFARSARA